MFFFFFFGGFSEGTVWVCPLGAESTASLPFEGGASDGAAAAFDEPATDAAEATSASGPGGAGAEGLVPLDKAGDAARFLTLCRNLRCWTRA